MNRLPLLALAVIVAVCCACHPTRDLTAPRLDMPGTFRTDSAMPPTHALADMDWRSIFVDSTLHGLIDSALTHNRDLLKAAARIDELRELYGIAKADFYPTVSGIIEGDREVKWYHYPDGHDTYSPDPQVGIKLSVGWEFNLWGKLNYARTQAASEFKATVEDELAARMSIVAQVASTYFNLIALDREREIVVRTLDTRRESVEKARLRYEAGLTSEIVYSQARTEYLSASSLLPEIDRREQLLRTALSVLTGGFPGSLQVTRTLSLDDVLPPALPVGVPSELLLRRPDLRASMARLKAAEAAVGVSYADRFPSIYLNFTGGLWNADFSGLFKSPYYFPVGGVGGSIFDFGRKKRAYKAAIARYEQARLTYEAEVVNAFAEVHDAVDSYHKYHATAEMKDELAASAESYLRLAVLQYHAGTTSYLDVLDAQRRVFSAQMEQNNAIRDEYLAFIQLYKSLGGGWR